jgi:YaiO family outer membrane protein
MWKNWTRFIRGRAVVIVLLACLSVITTLPQASAQETGESVVARARSLALAKQRPEALALLDKRLADHPDDTDARTLLGVILSWEGRYDDARKALESVLDHNPTHGDALPALINVELWSDQPARAEELINRALRSRPNDTALLVTKARALKALNRPDAAVDVLDKLLDVDPTNQEAKQMKENLKDSARNWETSLDQSYEWFSDNRAAWLETQLSLKEHTRIGSVIMRVSHAHRFSLDSNLLEVDAYPSLRPGTYAYLNAGWSPDRTLYPGYRLGGELFQSLHHGLEVSGGIRHLGFQDKVNIFTGSVTKYYGSWLFTARTFVTPSTIGDSLSMQYSARRYFGEGSSYVGARLGHGGGPVETGSVNETEVLRSTSVTGELNWQLGRRWTINLRGGESREDRLNNPRLQHHLADGALYFRF